MKFGAYMFSTDYSIRPDDLAKTLEDRGFESMWVPEHTHIPADRQTPFPGGGDLPKMYWHTYDPFVALTAAAAVTTTLKLGTALAASFGLTYVSDAFMFAFQIPNLFRRLFGEGAMSAAFVPVFTDYLQQRQRRDANALRRGALPLLAGPPGLPGVRPQVQAGFQRMRRRGLRAR